MAKNYTYNRVLTDKFNIKGVLSEDCKTITYVNGDKEELQIDVAKCFEPFKGEEITLVITVKQDQDLSDEFEEE